jgi:SNF2 family DNA or RNA helicase
MKIRAFRKHQNKMFAYTMRERNPALFVDMRLGKTLVTIRRVKLYKPLNLGVGLRVLVVAPSSAIGSWVDELEREGGKSLILSGPKAQRKKSLAAIVECSGWAIINKEGFLALPEIANISWDAVILDESTFIKNPRAKVTKFFTQHFRAVPHRWILTGTPAPETPLEYFPQLQFLDNRAFGFKNFWQFRAKMFEPGYSGYGWQPANGTTKTIVEAVSKRAMVMKRSDAGVSIKKVREVRSLELPKTIRALYDKAERDFELDGVETIWATTKYLWLRQICGGFANEKLVWDGKLKELVELLTGELADARVVVWFFFNDELEAAAKLLTAAGVSVERLTGQVKFSARAERLCSFRNGRARVLLAQQAVAQTGMDLSCADTAIYYSEPPGLLASQQTEDRILSLSKKTPLLYIHLLVKNSVDTDIHTLLRGKRFSSDLLAQKIKERQQCS